MAIPFPKQRGGTASTRPSSAGGVRMPIYPANDRYYGGGGSPSARPAPAGIFTPNQFRAPAISYGTPLQKATGAVTKRDKLLKSAMGAFGRHATRAVPYLALAEFASDILPFGSGWSYGANPKAPTPKGLWTKTAGDYAYGPPYHIVKYGTVKAHVNTWHNSITGQAQPGGAYAPFGVPYDWAQNKVGIWISNRNASVTRFAHHSSWVRTGSALAADNVTWRSPAVSPLSDAPWWDPMSTPPGKRANPRATPYPLIPYLGHNPYRSPIEQTQRGPSPRAVPPPAAHYDLPIFNGIGFTISPGYKPPVSPIGGRRPPRKPGPKERHSKWRGAGGGNFAGLMRVIGGVTEGLDLMNALWKALPKDAKTGYYLLHYRDKETGEIKTYYKYRHKASVTDKMKDLIKGWHKVDASKAISNVVDETIEDYIYGGIGKGYQKARGNLYRNENADFNKAREGYGRQYQKYVKRRKGDEWVDYGPRGRGFQTGQGYQQSGPMLEGGPRW